MARQILPIQRFMVPYSRGLLRWSLTIGGLEVGDKIPNGLVWMDRVTISPCTVEANLYNTDGAYTNLWNGGEEVIFKADYVDGTTQRFKGYLMKPEPAADRAPYVRITSKDYGVEAERKIGSFTTEAEADVGAIFKLIIEQFFPGHTTTNINTATGYTAQPSYQDIPIWLMLRDLALNHGRNALDFWCDTDKDWHLIVKGSLRDDSYPLFYGGNILGTPKMNTGIENKSNKVTVYGSSYDGVPIFATVGDTDDQEADFEMGTVITNTALTTVAQCKLEAQAQLAILLTTGKAGSVVTRGEIDRKAGYQHFVFEPHVPLHGYYQTSEVRHEVNRGRFSSISYISETAPMARNSAEIFKLIRESKTATNYADNKYGMEDCIAESFDNQLNGTFVNTQASNGRLILMSGTTGTWTSDELELDYAVAQMYLIVNGSDYEDSTFQYSTNGSDFFDITPVSLKTITDGGLKLNLKVILTANSTRPNPAIASINLGCKR